LYVYPERRTNLNDLEQLASFPCFDPPQLEVDGFGLILERRQLQLDVATHDCGGLGRLGLVLGLHGLVLRTEYLVFAVWDQ